MNNSYLWIALCLLLYGCGSKSSPFPAVKDIEELPTTMMVATMEEEVDWNKNILYCPTLLYAWEAIKDTLPQPLVLVVEKEQKPLYQLHASRGHIDALKEGEYEKSIKIKGNGILATTALSADLLLETPLEDNPISMSFDGQEVLCFGGNGKHAAVAEQVEVLFYESSEEFAVKIQPKDNSQVLILYKTKDKDKSSLDDLYKALQLKTSKYHPYSKSWKGGDVLAIPALAFNVEKEYQDLKDVPFLVNEEPYKVDKAIQRIALTFNKTGALVESEAEMVVSTRAAIMGRETFYLVFDDDFLLVAKKETAQQPYLLAWISNPTFMTKQ